MHDVLCQNFVVTLFNDLLSGGLSKCL